MVGAVLWQIMPTDDEESTKVEVSFLLLLLITPYFWEPNSKTSDGGRFLVYRLLCETYYDPSTFVFKAIVKYNSLENAQQPPAI